MGHRGGHGAHCPYLVNDMGNPWVRKFDPYPYPSKPVPVVQGYRSCSQENDGSFSRGAGGFQVVWMMFERSEGVVAVAF